jgi:spermidine/putrescine transport system permease protein
MIKHNILTRFFIFGLAFFYVVPLLYILLATFFNSPFISKWETISFQGVISIFDNNQLINSITNSLIIAVISSFFGMMLCVTYLMAIVSFNKKEKYFEKRIMSFPVFLPDIIWGLSILIVLRLLSVGTGYTVVLIIHIVFNCFLSYLLLRNLIINYPKSQVFSARLFGLNSFKTFVKVILPSNGLHFIGCFLLCFIYSFDDFLLTFLLGGSEVNTLPLFMYSKLKYGASAEIVAIAGVTTVFNLLILFLIFLINKKLYYEN